MIKGIRRFQGGWQSIVPPPLSEIRRRVYPPLDFYKVIITLKAFDLEQVI